MTDPISRDLDFYQNAIGLRQQRQDVLAGNIANADTPHYKARDFDFASALKRVGTQNDFSGLSLARTSARHFAGRNSAFAQALDMQFRQSLQPSLDGNTVDMDVERVQFADNATRYQADLALISQRIKSIQSALAQ